jgi:hypothetical protein
MPMAISPSASGTMAATVTVLETLLAAFSAANPVFAPLTV